MGNQNFTPQQTFGKNKPVGIRGCAFSKEHVPVELLRYGRLGYSQRVGKMYQSRPSACKVYVNKVKFQNGKDELFLCNDLVLPTKADTQPVKQSTVGRSAGPRNSGSRIVNSRYKS
jgi:hypothetical protein